MKKQPLFGGCPLTLFALERHVFFLYIGFAMHIAAVDVAVVAMKNTVVIIKNVIFCPSGFIK